MTERSFFKFGKSFFARGFYRYETDLRMTPADIKNLAGKKILLVGGGASPIKSDLANLGLDCHVTNIDIFYKTPDPNNADILITDDFINRHLIDEYDEIWALWSLPMYSPDDYARDMFWIRAILALKPGGNLRVSGGLQPAHTKLFSAFNAAFPDTELKLQSAPADKGHLYPPPQVCQQLESQRPAVPSPEIKDNSAEMLKDVENQDDKGYAMGAYYLHFTAPADKTRINEWLMQNLQRLNMPMAVMKQKRKEKI